METKIEAKELKVITAEPQIYAARFTPCGKFLLAASYDGRVRRWDATNDEFAEREAITGLGGWTTAIVCQADGEWLYSADSWGQIRCSSYAADMPQARWACETAHDGWVRELALSPDGKQLASSGIDKRVRLWSTSDGTKQADFATGEGPTWTPRNGSFDGEVACLRYTPDGQFLLIGDLKGIVHVWSLKESKVVRKFDASVLFKLDRLQDVGGVRCLAFDSELRWLAVGGTIPKNGGTVTGVPTLLVFDFATGEQKHSLSFGQPNDCYVTDVTFHPRGFVMVTTSGTPGSGQWFLQKLEDKDPLFQTKKVLNCQSVSLHPDEQRVAIVGTNAGSNGNGRPLNKEGKYPGNKSPIAIWRV